MNTKQERYERALDRLRRLSEDGVPIIVEGRRDEAALRSLGVSGPVIKIQGKRVAILAEEIGAKEAIVLTDFDPQGAKYSRQLKLHLERNSVKANTELRKQIFSNTFARSVEELKLSQALNRESLNKREGRDFC